MTKRVSLASVAAAIVIVVIWTGFVLVSRFGVKASLLWTDLAALRFGVSGVCMLPVVLWQWHRRGWAAAGGGLSFAQWIAIASTAGLGFGVFAFAGFSLAPAAHGAVLMTGTLPFWTASIAWLAFGERPRGAKAIGLLSILAGITAIGAQSIDVGSGTTAFGEAWRGDLCFLAASISWAVFLLIARRRPSGPVQTTAAIACGSALLYLPVYFAVLPKQIALAPFSQVVLIGAWQGLLSVVVNLLLYTRVLATFGPVPTAMLTAIVPALAAVLAVPLLGEPLTLTVVVGLVLVTAGMVIGLRR